MYDSAVPDFKVYSTGLFFCSVCSCLSPDDIQSRLNALNPSGTKLGWWMAEDQKFHSGEDNPCVCEDCPDTHKHYLFAC